MSGYADQEKLQQTEPVLRTHRHNDGFVMSRLQNGKILDPKDEKRAVEYFARKAVEEKSIEAAANLALYAQLDLNDTVLREGLINHRDIEGVEDVRTDLIARAKKLHELEDYCGYTAVAAIAGYYPPENIFTVQTDKTVV